MIEDISYGAWEGKPDCPGVHDTGRMDGWEYQEDRLVSVHPADVAPQIRSPDIKGLQGAVPRSRLA
jgi:hypothetical protein